METPLGIGRWALSAWDARVLRVLVIAEARDGAGGARSFARCGLLAVLGAALLA
jgi:hypothetical protein